MVAIVRIWAFIIAIFFLANNALARAGGGGGGGSHGGGGGGFRSYHSYGRYGYYHSGSSEPLSTWEIVFIVLVLAFVVFLVFYGFKMLILARKQKTVKKIAKSEKKDAFWNKEKMIAHVNDIYPKIQSAWTQRELKLVADNVTINFIRKFQPLLNNYKQKRIINVLDCIKIETVSIVKIEDHVDNNKDKFKAYIKGEMRDFLAHENGFTQLIDEHSEIQEFEDVFIFIRKDQAWLLDDIINDPTSFDLR